MGDPQTFNLVHRDKLPEFTTNKEDPVEDITFETTLLKIVDSTDWTLYYLKIYSKKSCHFKNFFIYLKDTLQLNSIRRLFYVSQRPQAVVRKVSVI